MCDKHKCVCVCVSVCLCVCACVCMHKGYMGSNGVYIKKIANIPLGFAKIKCFRILSYFWWNNGFWFFWWGLCKIAQGLEDLRYWEILCCCKRFNCGQHIKFIYVLFQYFFLSIKQMYYKLVNNLAHYQYG